MTIRTATPSRDLQASAWLMAVGQLLYIAVTQLHAGGPANDHSAVFAVYAGSEIWTAVHVAQFASVAILVAGLFALFSSLDADAGMRGWAARLGGPAAAVTLALYGLLQAVDGVALKHSVTAWASAPDAEKAARFASAEAVRWIEWGVRSYHDFALGLTLLLAGLGLGAAQVPRPLAYLIGLSGVGYLVQGWLLGGSGFSQAHSTAIVLTWIVSLVWMIWLLLALNRTR